VSVDYPDFVARFYDVVYAEVRDGVDNDYYLRQATACRGPVLELGVGTGRLFRAALGSGVDIDGVDISPRMIAQLKAKLDPVQHGRVSVADAVTMQRPRRYDLVLAPFRVLSHVTEVESQLRLLQNVYDHLSPGGRLIFDLYVPSPKLLSEGMHEVLDFDGEHAPGQRLKRYVSAHSDIVSQLTHCRMDFAWDEEGCERRAAWEFMMRFFFRFELEHLIARSPLKLARLYGDFEEHPLTPDSKEFVVVCERS
jgi:SAM-dependent methyltransferase